MTLTFQDLPILFGLMLGFCFSLAIFLNPLFRDRRNIWRYYPAFSDNNLIESENLYGDEMGSTDGGIVSTAADLGKFISSLGRREWVDSSSYAQMTDWFNLDPMMEYGHVRNGLGLEYYETDRGIAFGHGGSADGFYSVMHYFPEQDATLVILINGATIAGFDQYRETLFYDLLNVLIPD